MLTNNPEIFNEARWWKTGLGWGTFMFVLLEIFFPFLEKEPFELRKLIVGFVIWMMFGLLWAYTMKIYSKNGQAS
jgi:hypothetical protein